MASILSFLSCSSSGAYFEFLNYFFYFFINITLFKPRMSQAEVGEQAQKPTLSEPNLNLDLYSLERSEYRYLFVPTLNGVNTYTQTVAGGQQIVWELPAGQCYNLARSYLTFSVNIPEVAAKYVAAYADTIPWFRQIQVVGRNSGTQLCNINYLNKWLNTAIRREIKLQDITAWDTPIMLGGSGISTIIPATEGFWEGAALVSNCVLRPDETTQAIGTYATGGNMEPTYLMNSGLSGDGSQRGALNFNVRLPLARFLDTILAVDKSIYWPETLRLTFFMDGAAADYFTSATATHLISGVPTTAANSVVLSALTFMLCHEDNVLIQQKLRNTVESTGIRLPYDDIQASVINATGTGQSVITRYFRSMGHTLKKWYWVPMNSSDTGTNLYYDHSNLMTASGMNGTLSGIGAKIVNFYVQIDNVRVNKNNYNCATGDDWIDSMRDKSRGTSINSALTHYANFCHRLDFTNNYNFTDNLLPTNPPASNFTDGLDLSTEKIFNVVSTTAGNALNHYTFAVIQRFVLIKGDRIFLEA